MAKDKKEQAKQLETKGDKLFKQEKYAQALKAYEAAAGCDSENPELYQKLIETHGRSTEEWNVEEFTRELAWTMQQQELENPRLTRLHEQLSPEFKTITELIFQLAATAEEEAEEVCIDQIMAHGEKALVPLIQFIRALKESQES